jgi:hypothetical protein
MDLFGNSALDATLTTALQNGMRTAEELAITGFATASGFDLALLRQWASQRQHFTITSLGTNNEYWLLPLPGTGDDNSIHCAHIGSFGRPLARENWRKLTVVRGEGNILLVRPGWLRSA